MLGPHVRASDSSIYKVLVVLRLFLTLIHQKILNVMNLTSCSSKLTNAPHHATIMSENKKGSGMVQEKGLASRILVLHS